MLRVVSPNIQTVTGDIRDPAQLNWREVTKVAHYYLSVDAMTRPMQVREDEPPYKGAS